MAPQRRPLLQGIENHLRVLGCDVHTRVEIDAQIERLMPLLEGATEARLLEALGGVYGARSWREAADVVRGQ